eukprot:g77609.t1
MASVESSEDHNNASEVSDSSSSEFGAPLSLLSVSNLCQSLPDGQLILRDVSFEARPGDKVFITGPSGAGKTTLLRALASLDPLQVGVVSSPALDLWLSPLRDRRDLLRWRTEVTYVLQARVTRQGTPRSLFKLAKTFKAQRSRHHLVLDEVGSVIGVTSELLDQSWNTLSGGQAQRALLAVVLALRPAVLLLDEPTAALDHANADNVEALLRATTAVWISHDPQQAARMDGRALDIGQYSLVAPKPAEIELGVAGRAVPPRLSKPATKSSGGWLLPGFLALLVAALLLWAHMQGPFYEQLVGRARLLRHSDTKEITPVVIAASFAACNALVALASWHFQLQLVRDMLVASSQAVLQLSLLGLVLVPVFHINKLWLVLPYILLMMLVAAQVAISRIKYLYPFMYVHVLLSMTFALVCIGGGGLYLIGEGLNAQYAIPMCGMLLGNCMKSITLAVDDVLTALYEQPKNTEMLLCLGASRWEAGREPLQKAMYVGLTPVIQTIASLGTVTIPGMMTGQILGGTVPWQAAWYQILIYLMILCCVLIGMLLGSLAAVGSVLDRHHQLRTDRLTKHKECTHPYRVALLGRSS